MVSLQHVQAGAKEAMLISVNTWPWHPVNKSEVIPQQKKLNAALQSEDFSEEPQVLSAAFETGPYFQSHCTR